MSRREKRIMMWGGVSVGVLVVLIVWNVRRPLRTQTESASPTPGFTMSESSETLVSGFPDFPMYPGTRLISSYRKTEGGKEGYQAIWESDDSMEVVGGWFEERFGAEEGWQVVESPDRFEGEPTFVVEREGRRFTLGMEMEEERKTTISLEMPLQ